MMSMMRFLSVVATAAVFSFILVLATFEINDPDTMQYLASGRYILSNGLIRGCVFTYTLTDCIVTYSEWFWVVLVYLIYSIASWNGLVALQVFLAVSTFVVVFLSNRESKNSLQAILSILFLSALVTSERFMLRADTFGLLPLTLFYFLLKRLVTHDFFPRDKKKRILYFTLLFLVQLLWTNTHGSFPMAFVVIISFLLPRFIRAGWQLVSSSQVSIRFERKTKMLLLVTGIAVGASLINPYGIKAFFWPFLNTQATASKQLVKSIAEYQSPFAVSDFPRWTLQSYYLLVAVTVTLLAVNARRIRISDLLLLTPFFLLSIQGVRYIATFAVVAGFILPQYLDGFSRVLKHWLFTKSFGRTVSHVTHIGISIGIILVSIVFGQRVVTNELYAKYGSSRRFGVGLSSIEYPVAAAAFVKREKLPGNMFNSYDFGGYLNFMLYPQYKTFMHGTVLDFDLVHSVWLYRYYRDVNLGDISYNEAAQKYGIKFFLLNHVNQTTTPLVTKLFADKENWRLVYADYLSVIFLKNTKENEPIIQRYTVDLATADPDELVRPDSFSRPIDRAVAYNAMGVLYAKLQLHDKARDAYTKAIAIAPDNFRTYNNLGILAVKTGNYEDAIRNFQKALSREPSIVSVHFELGDAYLYTKQYGQAKREYLKTIALDRTYPLVHYRLAVISLTEGKKGEARDYFLKEMNVNPGFHPQSWELKQYGLSP